MPTIKAECEACKGTGLYCGFAEPEGTAVICNRCDGTGCCTITYKKFTKRKRKRGIRHVIADVGPWFARDGSEEIITVQEFYEHDPQLKKKDW